MKQIDRLFFLLVFSSAALIAWASLHKLDQVVRGEALVLPKGDAIEVRARHSGMVEAVLMQLGDRVNTGQLLIVMDPEGTDDDVVKLRERLDHLKAVLFRLDAQITETPLSFPSDIPATNAHSQRLIYEKSVSEVSILENIAEIQSRAFDSQREITLASVGNLQQQLELANREIELLQRLVEARAESELTLVHAQLRKAELVERLDSAKLQAEKSLIDKALAANEVEKQLNELLGSWRAESAEVEAEIQSVVADINKALDLNSLRTIESPIDGLVSKLAIKSAGQHAREFDLLAELVPLNTSYVVVAKIGPRDIGKLRQGQPARLSLQSFDFAKHGHIDVTVETIAQNVIEPENAPPFYEVYLTINAPVFSKTGEPVPLMPGLLGSVDILNEPVTVLQYLTTPIQRAIDRALTEG